MADDDDYDPRKPQYIQEATAQEKGQQNAALLLQQIDQLEKALASGRESRAPDIASHYQKVAHEMRISAQQLLSGDTSISPCQINHGSAWREGLWKCWLDTWSGMLKNGSWPPRLFSASSIVFHLVGTARILFGTAHLEFMYSDHLYLTAVA